MAIVTGASGGIGRATAEGLADAGLTALVDHLRGDAVAGDVVAAEAAGGKAFAVSANVADRGSEAVRHSGAVRHPSLRRDLSGSAQDIPSRRPDRRRLHDDYMLGVSLKGTRALSKASLACRPGSSACAASR
ncbi:SDR family NAD(P)-dependent oxidoreductase [Streptomyces luomodiensis]|uniref:SDR family NAD(P)-dependent oxidoreductase n=1 Tax=Streptomyces luomodiensis TaxID=3026192 RepID=A0ABY9UY64_9ACTN|nr:SDR family NAD(P)-dependent oxidoreductase [Streptomyces sp. SCA4-21]WNE95410.1 SDR family NAD(P)-dependent oxidoreductase [Streptomyces sp. SCA4-21]